MSEIKYPVRIALSPDVPEEEADADTMQVILDATGRALEIEEIAEVLNKGSASATSPSKSARQLVSENMMQALRDQHREDEAKRSAARCDKHGGYGFTSDCVVCHGEAEGRDA